MRAYWPSILLLASMWGASYLFIKLAVDDMPPAAMTEIRVLAAGLLLFAYLCCASARDAPSPSSAPPGSRAWCWA